MYGDAKNILIVSGSSRPGPFFIDPKRPSHFLYGLNLDQMSSLRISLRSSQRLKIEVVASPSDKLSVNFNEAVVV